MWKCQRIQRDTNNFFLCATMLIVKVEVKVCYIQDSVIKMLNIYIGSIEFLSYDRIYIESF